MKPDEILRMALSDGVKISNGALGKIKVEGDERAVKKWLPVITENKKELSELVLKGSNVVLTSPVPCRACKRLETIFFLGEPLHGCVRKLENGPWVEEWKRIPRDLKQCMIH